MGIVSRAIALALALACACAAASPSSRIGASSSSLARALAADDVASVLAVAYSDDWEAALAAQGAEWVSTNATLRTLMGSPPSPDTRAVRSSIHSVYATLADGRAVSVNMQSARLAGLPPSGDNIPLQGVLADGTLILDSVSHYCDATEPPFFCSIGSDADLPFESDANAATEAGVRVGAGVDAHLASLHLPSILDTLGLRPDTRRRLQQNATNDNALEQFPASEAMGSRKVLMFRVFFTGPTSTCDNVPVRPESVAVAAATVAQLYGVRSFGGVQLLVDIAPCTYYLPNYDTYWISDAPYYSLMKIAGMSVVKNGDTNGCPAFNPTVAYDHYIMVHPKIKNVEYAGLGEAPGRFVWLNGQGAVDECGGACVVAHEIGHNYGLHHAGVVVYGERMDYGDFTDNMGSGSRNSGGMNNSDYSALAKHAIGWIPNSRVVNLDPSGAGVLAGARLSASFLMAALDRDNAINDRTGALALLPASAALVARTAVPMRSYLTNQGSQQYLYIFNRVKKPDHAGFGTTFNADKAGITSPGLFLAEFSIQTNMNYEGLPATWGVSGPPVLHCYRDPSTCTSQWQIAANDAYVFDPAGLKLLIQVGSSVRIIPGSAATLDQDSALNVRIAYLDGTATITDPSVAPRPYVPMTSVAATGTLSYTLSPSSPVSVYKVVSATATYVSAQICCVSSCDLSVMGVSAFLGGFPAAATYYGGNVGVTGDVNWPGDLDMTGIAASELRGGGWRARAAAGRSAGC